MLPSLPGLLEIVQFQKFVFSALSSFILLITYEPDEVCMKRNHQVSSDTGPTLGTISFASVCKMFSFIASIEDGTLIALMALKGQSYRNANVLLE